MFRPAKDVLKDRWEAARNANPKYFDKLMSLLKGTHDPSACWEYTQSKTRDGYGQIRVNGPKHRTHRLMFEWFYRSKSRGCGVTASIPFWAPSATRVHFVVSRSAAVANVISADINGPAKMTDVPDGEWPGVWSGYQVSAVCGHGKWTFTTDEGVRGVGIGCIVTVRSGRISVRVHHPPL